MAFIRDENMTEQQHENLRSERLSLCIGILMGEIAQLLNSINKDNMTIAQIYHDLNDIHQSGALQVHNLYYKGNTP